MKRSTTLKLAYERPPEHVFGSDRFISLTRNRGLVSPTKFVPTVKGENDVII
jgi:hypothetical protein